MRLADAAVDARTRRDDMRRLAARFPGALREIAALPMEEIDRRIAALDAVVAGETGPPPWAECLACYHGWMRAALRIRSLRGAASTGAALAARLKSVYRPEPDEPALDRLPPALLEGVLRPAGGRLNAWVAARVAEDLGLPPAEVEERIWQVVVDP